MFKEKKISFVYTNWKGNKGVRNVDPVRIWFGSTEYHPEEQWFLRAFDLDKGEYRDFALKDIDSFRWEERLGE